MDNNDPLYVSPELSQLDSLIIYLSSTGCPIYQKKKAKIGLAWRVFHHLGQKYISSKIDSDSFET